MLVDDISTHDGFTSFARHHPGYQTVICPSADQEREQLRVLGASPHSTTARTDKKIRDSL